MLSEQQPLSYLPQVSGQSVCTEQCDLGLSRGPPSLPGTPCLPSHHSSASYCFISQELFSPFLSFLCFCHFFHSENLTLTTSMRV